MSRKDYRKLAAALAAVAVEDDHGPRDGAAVLGDVRRAIADVLAADNPRFDRERFLAACGGQLLRRAALDHRGRP
jgi:hypothetical protein